MDGMFFDASSFNQDLEDWGVDSTKVPGDKQQNMFTNTALTTTPSWFIWDGGDNFTNYEGFTSNYNDYDDDEYNDTCYYINLGNHYITDFFNNM